VLIDSGLTPTRDSDSIDYAQGCEPNPASSSINARDNSGAVDWRRINSYLANRRNRADHESGDEGSYGCDIDAKQRKKIPASAIPLINDRDTPEAKTKCREGFWC